MRHRLKHRISHAVGHVHHKISQLRARALRRRIFFLGFVAVIVTGSIGWFVASMPFNYHEQSAFITPNTPPNKKNVVIISIDSVRADHMSLYGYARNTTPYIDTFAHDAVVFDNFFSTGYLTPISETSVQTGLYPASSKVINFESHMSGKASTLAELLKENGYRTAAMGTSPEYKAGHEVLMSNFIRGFDTYQKGFGGMSRFWFGRDGLPTKKAIAWMQQKDDKPFYLWLHVGSAHWPYGQNEPHHFSSSTYDGFLKSLPQNASSESHSNFDLRYGRYYNGKQYEIGGEVVSTDVTDDIAYVNGRYDDGLVMTDRQIEQVLAYLAQPSVRDSTIVIIESEHGEDLGDHGYIAHYDVMDTQTHVPLIMRVPNVSPKRIQTLASGVDIVPTIMDLLGLTYPRVDGVSQAPLIRGETTTPARTEVYLMRTPLWERLMVRTNPWLQPFVEEDNTHHYYDVAIRTDTWKLVHRLSRDIMKQYSWYGHLTGTPIEEPEYELYNFSNDPHELHNVYDENRNNPVVKSLTQKLKTWENHMKQDLQGVRPAGPVQPYF